MIKDLHGNKYYKVALHLHTTLSDGRLSPDEVLEMYGKEGYDAVALTDHWIFGKSFDTKGLHIISGIEYDVKSGPVTHIVGLGMKNDPELSLSANGNDITDAIKNAGGIAVLAHPAWSINTLAHAKTINGIECTEIYNAVSDAGMSMRPYSDEFIDAAANEGMFYKVLATDDAHYYNNDDNCRGYVYVKADELTDEAIVRALRRGDSFASQGPMLFTRREGNKIIADTSPCSVIGTLSNKAWAPKRVIRGENLTHFEYEIASDEKWIRLEARDSHGKKAWSNIFTL